MVAHHHITILLYRISIRMIITGSKFEPIKLPLVTLIDTLDTLALMGEYAEFRLAVERVNQHIRTFDYDVNVSVFETTIR